MVCYDLIFSAIGRCARCQRRWLRRILTGLLLTVSLTTPAEVPETELAAAYLYNFSKFVRWPAGAFGSADAPLQLCLYGRVNADDAMYSLEGKLAQGHTIDVDRRPRGTDLTDCHIVAVSTSEQSYLAPLLRTLVGYPVLTVSELPDFASAGGIIGFVWLDNRLRFEINTVSAAAAGLTISSQLLKLAAQVVRE